MLSKIKLLKSNVIYGRFQQVIPAQMFHSGGQKGQNDKNKGHGLGQGKIKMMALASLTGAAGAIGYGLKKKVFEDETRVDQCKVYKRKLLTQPSNSNKKNDAGKCASLVGCLNQIIKNGMLHGHCTSPRKNLPQEPVVKEVVDNEGVTEDMDILDIGPLELSNYSYPLYPEMADYILNNIVETFDTDTSFGLTIMGFLHVAANEIFISQIVRHDIPDEITQEYLLALLREANSNYAEQQGFRNENGEIIPMPVLNQEQMEILSNLFMMEIIREVGIAELIEEVKFNRNNPNLVDIPLYPIFEYPATTTRKVTIETLGRSRGFYESRAIHHLYERSNGIEKGGKRESYFLGTLAVYQVPEVINRRYILFLIQMVNMSYEMQDPNYQQMTNEEVGELLDEFMVEVENGDGIFKLLEVLWDIQHPDEAKPAEDDDWQDRKVRKFPRRPE